jgi:hypothetical protein
MKETLGCNNRRSLKEKIGREEAVAGNNAGKGKKERSGYFNNVRLTGFGGIRGILVLNVFATKLSSNTLVH